MPRLRNSETGRIINVDDDQVEAFKEYGFKQRVKGIPAPDESVESSSPKKSSK